MRTRELERCLREWKKLLRLSDWEITITRKKRKSSEDPLALSSISFERKVSRISFWFPHVDKDGSTVDPRSTLVHELLHIFYDPWYPYDKEKPLNKPRVLLIEHSVESLALALYDLRYKKNVHPRGFGNQGTEGGN